MFHNVIGMRMYVSDAEKRWRTKRTEGAVWVFALDNGIASGYNTLVWIGRCLESKDTL